VVRCANQADVRAKSEIITDSERVSVFSADVPANAEMVLSLRGS
jgi:hypothetical protein